MPIGLTDFIEPKNDAFVGIAQAQHILGGGDHGTLPVATLPTVPILKGGTGQTIKVAAFDALSPMTTKGDLIVRTATDNARLPVGTTNGQVVAVASGEAAGVKWVNPWAGMVVAGVFYLQDPAAADVFIMKGVPKGATLNYASYIVDTGSLKFTVEKRANATPFSTGTAIWTTPANDKTATSTSANTSSFDSGTIAARDMLFCRIASIVSGTPTGMFLYLEWGLA